MKTIKTLFKITLACIIIFSLGACFTPLRAEENGETATITINLGGSAARAATGFSDAVDSDDLTYKLFLLNTNTSQREEIPVNSTTNTASKQVSPGSYEIEVFAQVKGWDYAENAPVSFSVAAGETKDIPVTMHRLPYAIVLSMDKEDFLAYSFASIETGTSLAMTDPLNLTVYNFSDNPSVSIKMSDPVSGGLIWSMYPASIAQDASALLTIEPNSNTTGVYEEVLTIGGPGGFSASINLSFIVYPEPGIPITSESELDAIRGNLSGNYILGANLNLSSYSNWTPIGSYPGGGDYSNCFSGTFDGNGHTISNLTITNSGPGGHGLFGYIAPGGVVKNLRLDNVYISSTYTVNDWVGAIAGGNAEGTVENCYVEGTVEGYNQVGAIVGRNLGTVQNCYSEGSVSGYYTVGGIVGMNDMAVTVKNCYSLATVSGDNLVGGIVGNYYIGNIENCVALNPSVTASTSGGGRIAGGTSAGPIATLSGNYAQTGMTVTIGLNSNTPSGTTGDINGADVNAGTSSGQYNNQDFWDGLGWDFFSVWDWGSNDLPALRM